MRGKQWTCMLLILSLCLSFCPFISIANATGTSGESAYIDKLSFARGRGDNQVLLLQDSLNATNTYDEFAFDPGTTTYNIMLLDGAVDNQLAMRITPKASGSRKLLDGTGAQITTTGAEKAFNEGTQDNINGMAFFKSPAYPAPTMTDSEPVIRTLVLGVKEDDAYS